MSAAQPGDILVNLLSEAGLSASALRLSARGEDWARRRRSDWACVLNACPLPSAEALHPFRWRLVAESLRHAAGSTPEPPADRGALPVGLQGFLAWGVPAALRPVAAETPDLERASRAYAAAEQLAANLAADRDLPTDATPSPHMPGPGPATAAAADLITAALSCAPATAPVAGAADLLERLRSGPLPLAEVRRLAAERGLLPGTLLDRVDRLAVGTAGVPAVVIEGGRARLSAACLDALRQG